MAQRDYEKQQSVTSWIAYKWQVRQILVCGKDLVRLRKSEEAVKTYCHNKRLDFSQMIFIISRGYERGSSVNFHSIYVILKRVFALRMIYGT